MAVLTDGQIRDFHTVGWIHIANLFDLEEVEQIRACFTNLERIADGLTESVDCEGSRFILGEKNGEQVIKRVIWAGASQPYLLDIGADRRLTSRAAQLLGSSQMEQLLNQAHFKRPNDGVVFGWHQDIRHRDKGKGTWTDVNGKGSFVQTLIAIDEMTPDSGPLQFIPASSSWGAVDFGDHDYDDPNYELKRPPQFNEDDAVTILANPGDTLFFGPYTAHASFENTSDSYRRVLINGYAFPGANNRVYPGSGLGRTINTG